MSFAKSLMVGMAAFIAALMFSTVSASALAYDSCPASAKVEDSFWNPSACSGGVYGRGTLYVMWNDAPFNDDSTEVEGYTLTVSGISKGTLFSMYVWNGNSWTILSGGILDFRGDYVYNLHLIPRPYTDGTMRIKIVNRGTETLHISGLRVSAEYESRERDVTFIVKDCDTGRKLSSVEVTVGDITKGTDSSGEAVFNLSKGKSYLSEFSLDGYFDVKKSVYVADSDGQEYSLCMQKEKSHEIDVKDLDVDGNYIDFDIENTGNVDETVQYTLYINDNVIFTGNMLLDTGEEETVTGTYAFNPGKYRVKARAVASGYADSETVTHCVAGYTGKQICSSGKLLTEVMRKGCSAYWEDTGKTCEGDTNPPDDGNGGTCAEGIGITSIDFLNDIPSNVQETLTVSFENTGTASAVVKLRLYVDGTYKSEKSVTVAQDKTGSASFRFTMAKGTHEIRVDAVTCGSVADTAKGTVTVTGPSTQAGVPEGPDVEDSPVQEGIDTISIETDESITISKYDAGTLKVTVYPPTEKYTVSVSGVDGSWLSYQRELDSIESRDFYIYISPTEEGNYTMKIRVWLGEAADGVFAEEKVKLIVTGKAGASNSGKGGITGLMTSGYAPALLIVITAVVITAVVISSIAAFAYMRTRSGGLAADEEMKRFELAQMKRTALDSEGHVQQPNYQNDAGNGQHSF